MNLFERFVHSMQWTAPMQTEYGLFHIFFLIFTICLTVLLILKFKNSDEKTYKTILFFLWIILVLFEIYKQLVFSFNYDGVTAYWDYQWYAFPFQFCSTPMYTLPFIIFIKNKKINIYAEAFLSLYSLFAGLAVMIAPGSVFHTTLIGVAVQTMIHHGFMIVIGSFIISRNIDNLNLKYFLKSVITFLILIVVAIILNETIIFVTTETFNMFFISRHFECTLLSILATIQNNFPYIVFLLVYILCFSLAALIILYVIKYTLILINKITHKN
ncbi:MAG: YwaF family protein [Clostridia bacterium]|nr:YwaF family protein [Clostridia bacterium]